MQVSAGLSFRRHLSPGCQACAAGFRFLDESLQSDCKAGFVAPTVQRWLATSHGHTASKWWPAPQAAAAGRAAGPVQMLVSCWMGSELLFAVCTPSHTPSQPMSTCGSWEALRLAQYKMGESCPVSPHKMLLTLRQGEGECLERGFQPRVASPLSGPADPRLVTRYRPTCPAPGLVPPASPP